MLQVMQYNTSPHTTPPPSEPACNHPQAKTRDPVWGVAYCRAEREASGKGACGKSGRLFEQAISKP